MKLLISFFFSGLLLIQNAWAEKLSGNDAKIVITEGKLISFIKTDTAKRGWTETYDIYNLYLYGDQYFICKLSLDTVGNDVSCHNKKLQFP